MKRKLLLTLFYFVTLVVIIVNSVYLVKENFFININSLPKGEYQYNNYSPENTVELRVYYIQLPVGNSVRISKTDKDGTSNIFWQTGVDDVEIEWQNDVIVEINGIQLDLEKDEYFDCRSISSIFNDGLMGR